MIIGGFWLSLYSLFGAGSSERFHKSTNSKPSLVLTYARAWSLIVNRSDHLHLISFFSDFLITNQKYVSTKRFEMLPFKKPSLVGRKMTVGKKLAQDITKGGPPLVLKGLNLLILPRCTVRSKWNQSLAKLWSKMLIFKRVFHNLRVLPQLFPAHKF